MSTIKVDTVRPVTADASLTLQGDNSGTGVSGITIDSSGNVTLAGNLSAPNFVGMIAPFAMSSTPTGWLSCDGSAVSRTTYANLFTVISTIWGVGDGSTTFNLPDLRGAFLRGSGTHGSETMADSNSFAGPSVGSFEDDGFQGFQVGATEDPDGARNLYGAATVRDYRPDVVSQTNSSPMGMNTGFQGISNGIYPVDDGTNGTPRSIDETRPFNAGILYCIKF